jgi:hypothetical protein
MFCQNKANLCRFQSKFKGCQKNKHNWAALTMKKRNEPKIQARSVSDEIDVLHAIENTKQSQICAIGEICGFYVCAKQTQLSRFYAINAGLSKKQTQSK